MTRIVILLAALYAIWRVSHLVGRAREKAYRQQFPHAHPERRKGHSEPFSP
ncbi:MAG: hypothetical protein V1750_01930 [Acidobacteriota bacterium]